MMRPGQAVILITVALLCFGVVMVNSAGLSIGAAQPLDLRALLLDRTALFAALAIAMLVAGAALPADWLARARGGASPIPWILLGAIVLLLLVHVPGIGREVNGARRWIQLGAVGFQPSEIAKWSVPLALAWYASRWPAAMEHLGRGVLIPLGLVAAVCLLIATEDLGTAVLIGSVGVALVLAAGARWWQVASLAPGAALGFVAALLHSPYRLQRLQAFLDPYADAQGSGYHMVQSMAAVSSGGLAGRGLGNSVHKFGYLPEDTTDFIFAIICEELGIIGALLIICLYGALCLYGLWIIRHAAERFQQLLGLGILLTIALQSFINLAVVTGCGPTKGIALPLVSAGGTGWVLTALSLGILAGMDPARAERRAPRAAVALQPP